MVPNPSRDGPPNQDAGRSPVDDWLASCQGIVLGDEWIAFVCGDPKLESVSSTVWKARKYDWAIVCKAGSGFARNGPPPTWLRAF